MLVIYVLIGLFAGFAIANMTPINSDLRTKVGSPFVAIVISITISTIITAIATLITKQALWPSGNFIETHPPFIWIGGIIGAIYVTSNVLMFPKIGSIETVVLPLLGQILCGVMIDTFGLFALPKIPLHWTKILGVLLLMVGLWVTIVLSENRRTDQLGTTEGGERWAWRIWGFLIGGATAVQQTINGALGGMLTKATGISDPLQAQVAGTIQGSFFAFFVGLVAIVVITLIANKGQLFPDRAQWRSLTPVNFLGGFFNGIVGMVRMFLRIVLSQTIVVALVDFGQIATGLLVQQFGWWHSPKHKVNPLQIIGLAVMFLGVLMIVGVFKIG